MANMMGDARLRHQFSHLLDDDELPAEFYGADAENMSPKHYGLLSERLQEPSSRRDVADAMARRILAERDDSVHRVRELEMQAVANAELAAGREALLQEAAYERDELLDELYMTRDLLADACGRGERAVQRVRQLEEVLARLVLDTPAAAAPPPPPREDDDSAFGLTRSKEAIVKAVHDAAKLPSAERRKKIRALRLKWHPDKHETLKELAEEVTKLINVCVDEIGGEDGPTAGDVNGPSGRQQDE